MALVARVKNILLAPKTEWPLIAGETSSTGDLMGGYVAPLAGAAALAGFIGSSFVGFTVPMLGNMRSPIGAGLGTAVFTFVMAFVGVYLLSMIINALAPSFGGEKNPAQALKVSVYAYTPAWIAGLLQVIPLLGILGLVAAFYGIYLLYLGLPALMKNPAEKSVGYTAVVVICAIVIGFVLSFLVGSFSHIVGGGAGMMGSSMIPGRGAGATFDKDSPMGKLEDIGRKMEAAQKSGDQQAQMKAAMEGLGAVLGGGKRYEPLALDSLKPFAPESLGGLARTAHNSERGGMAGLEIAKVEADYGDGAQKSIRLEIVDTGGAAGLMGLAGWANLQGEKENQRSIERTRKEGDRLVHEKISKTGGANEVAMVLGNRFIVEAKGRGMTFDELKSALASLNLGKLEAMKEMGAKK